MLLDIIKKHFFIICIFLLVNILIFIFWWVVTDPGNYIWNDIDNQSAALLYSACNKLFLIRYYVSFVIINAIVIASYMSNTKRLISFGIVLFVVAFYFFARFIFGPYVGRNYYVIFENQHVSNNFLLEPIADAGIFIAPYLVEKLNEAPSYKREQAAKGLGVIEYMPAVDKLNSILIDTAEAANMRAECYYSLKKINTAETKILLENFSRSTQLVLDTVLVTRINYLELQDIY